MRLRLLLLLYRLAWIVGLPLVVAYFFWRGRRDPQYAAHLGERFALGPAFPDAVWIHAVSLGEFRSAVPLIRGPFSIGVKGCSSPASRPPGGGR